MATDKLQQKPTKPVCVCSLPGRAANKFQAMKLSAGVSDFQVAGLGLLVLLVFGMVCIFGLDRYFAANPHLLADQHQD